MESEKIDVLVFGSAIIDFISYVKRMPKVGETIHGYKFKNGFGGKGANQCIAAAKLKSSVAFVGKLGSDSWGDSYKKHFEDEGVNVDFLEIVQDTTGIAQILVSDTGDNLIVIVVGANNLLNEEDVVAAKELFQRSKVLVCQLETPIAATIKALEEFPGISILNAAPGQKNLCKELFTYPNIFCVNELEAEEITGLPVPTPNDAKVAVEKLLEMGCNIVIITMGASGVIFASTEDRRAVHIPAPKIEKVVDTTGAGDAFIGALAHFIAKYPKGTLLKNIGCAMEIASSSVQFEGTQSSYNSFPADIDPTIKTFEFHYL